MPGVFLVDRSGIIRFIHRYRDISDNPPNELLLEWLARE
jgi:peroxiredoxin